MFRAVILASDPNDYQIIRTHLTELNEETHPQGTIYEVGQFPENEQVWKVAIAEIDSNNASSAAEAERAIKHFKPDVIFLISAATGIKNVHPGDIVIANKVYGYESGRVDHEFRPRPEVLKPSYPLRERAKVERRNKDWFNHLSTDTSNLQPSVFLAPIASGEKELADAGIEFLEFLHSQYNDAIAAENSGFGVLQAVSINESTLALTVHGISRVISEGIGTELKDVRDIAINHASAFVFRVLSQFKVGNAATTDRIEGVVSYGITPEDLFTGIGHQVKATINASVTDERHKRVNHSSTLINQGEYRQAIQYLTDLKSELWHQADDRLKYRLLANLGVAQLGFNENIVNAATLFIEALQYNPEDEKAIAYAAMGYVFQGDLINSEKHAEKALQKNPASTLAYSLRIRSAPKTVPFESLLELVPEVYHTDIEILIALGEAALNRRLYEKARESFQVALDLDNGHSMNNVRAFLGVSILEPISHYFPLITAGQLLDSQKEDLEQAITIFTEALGGDYPDPNNLSHPNFTALVNRAAALRLLGRYDESIRDIKIARQKKPTDPYLIKQRALLAHEKTNYAEAYDYIQPVLSSPEMPESHLIAANSLANLSRFEEAESLLDDFIQTDYPKELRETAKRLKFGLLLEQNKREIAEAILNEIIQEDAENIFTLISKIKWQKYIDDENPIPELIEQAKSTLTAKDFRDSILPQLELAELLCSLNYYRDAAEVYEQFVDQSHNTRLAHQLCQSYYFAGDYRKVLNLCQQLLNKYGPLPIISEMAAHINGEIGNIDVARTIREDYLDVYPDDVRMQLRLAVIDYATGEFEKLDEFLDSHPNFEGFSIDEFKKLAQLHKVRNRIDYFLEVIYEMRHCFYENGQTHAYYQISYLEATKTGVDIQSFESVQNGCGVLLVNEFNKEQWYILEDREDSKSDRNELNANHPLYQALIGKRLGEEIIQAEDSFGKNALRIGAITNKYFAAGKQSFEVLENQPSIKDFRAIAVPTRDNEISPDWVQQFIEGIKQHQKHYDQAKALYTSEKVPLGSVAILLNQNPIKVWQTFALGAHPHIHAWSNFKHEKFEDALLNLQKGGFVVIDPISLITLHHFKIADDVVRTVGRFGVAQSTINLFQAMVETSQGLNKEGFTTVGVENDQNIWIEITPEQVARQKIFFERIIAWVRENCEVLPCHKALDISNEERTQLNEYIGLSFTDTALIAAEPGRVLYSDDQFLRWHAHLEFGVPGIWTQVILDYCFRQRNVNESLYQETVIKLALYGYSYTIIDAGILFKTASYDGWKPQATYISVLKSLAHRNTNLYYMASVVADFLRMLYLENIISDSQFLNPRDDLVFTLLRILTGTRSTSDFFKVLIPAIQERFQLIPIHERHVIENIYTWASTQSVIT
ncbi:hypothetical protein D0962_16475 [Leptolyngbyaceae cyanobacterium CCMR0082]|uniref:Nucleoside phosphorylase domain-containing protein n=1 Tax=Adonisia turfae CCMR0082 TaxID=2304604 RepID=A0A6M0S7C9_9CYAN|nr:hypothetical protein [Adonisia turfae]NEZ64367.1 hypothetical protein [Adonisia turfae CCMR0082]